MEEDLELVDIIEDSNAQEGFVPRRNFETVDPFLKQEEPVENLDDLQEVPSQTPTQEREEETGAADYAGVGEGYAGMGGEQYQPGYFGTNYAGTGESETSMPRQRVDMQEDLTGGALRMDEQTMIRESSAHDPQRTVDVGRWQQTNIDMQRQSRDYVGTPGRESDITSGDLPFKRDPFKERRKF